MEGAGLVERIACPTDRRGTYTAITEKGRTTLRASAPTHLRGIEEHFGRHLTDAEARTLRRALGKVAAAVEKG